MKTPATITTHAEWLAIWETTKNALYDARVMKIANVHTGAVVAELEKVRDGLALLLASAGAAVREKAE